MELLLVREGWQWYRNLGRRTPYRDWHQASEGRQQVLEDASDEGEYCCPTDILHFPSLPLPRHRTSHVFGPAFAEEESVQADHQGVLPRRYLSAYLRSEEQQVVHSSQLPNLQV